VLFNPPLDGPRDAADHAQEGANQILNSPLMERDKKSVPDGDSDLAKSISGAVSAMKAVMPAAFVGIAIAADKDSDSEQDQITAAMAVSAQVAWVADDGVRAAPREAAMLALTSADVMDSGLLSDPRPVLAEAPAPLTPDPQEIAGMKRSTRLGLRAHPMKPSRRIWLT
jgi:hypothetical protein